MSITTDHSRATADGAHNHGSAAPVVANASRADRLRSFTVADFPLPSMKEENWRFTPLKTVQSLFADEAVSGELTWSWEALPAGVSVTEIDAELARAKSVMAPGDRAAAVASARATGVRLIDIAANAALTEPIHITCHGAGGAAREHTVMQVGAGAEATVVLTRTGDIQLSEFFSVEIGANASLNLVVIQNWDATAIHSGEIAVHLHRDARLRSSVVTLGGKAVRVNTNAKFVGEGGRVDLFGLYFADSGQHQEHQLFVDHAEPHCTSRVTYKGALAGKSAHTVWIGDVLIRAAAEGTDTYELNRNLVLTDGARADSVPNLEIETGEIEGAGHASATGRFDDEQMFYLRSRGISEEEARKLVVRGFFADLIHEIGVPEVEASLLREIDLELEQVHG